MPNERKSVSELTSHKPFYPNLPRKDKEELIGVPFVIYGWEIVNDWNSQFGKSSFVIVAGGDEDSKEPEFTTLLSGMVIMKKMEALRKKAIKECMATLVKQPSESGNEYYDLI